MAYVVVSQMGDCSFCIEIAGYEFPELSGSEHRNNKLLITFTAKNLDGSWSLQKPLLLTWEVEEIIRWARKGYSLEPLIMFVNPSIQLYADPMNEQQVHLQLTIADDLLPTWHMQSPITMDLIVSQDVLKEFASDLESELSRYPYRSSDLYD